MSDCGRCKKRRDLVRENEELKRLIRNVIPMIKCGDRPMLYGWIEEVEPKVKEEEKG